MNKITSQQFEQLQQDLVLAREISDRRGEGTVLGNPGLAYHGFGRMEEAIDFYQESIAIFEEIQSPNAEIVRGWLNNLNL